MRRRRFRIRKWMIVAVAVAALGAPAAAQPGIPDEPGVTAGNPGAVLVEPQAPTVTTPGGFDWSDAGVGAGIALGAIGLSGAALVGLARNRNRVAVS